MEEQIISFEIAKLAQEKGCKETIQLGESLYIYNVSGRLCKEYNYKPDYNATVYPDIIAPTQSLLQKWLREKHRINITPHYHKNGKYSVCISDEVDNCISTKLFGELFKTYEEALEEGLKQALNLINN